MADQVLPIQGLDQTGVIYDTPPVALPPNAFSDVRNVRFKDGAVRKMEGEVNLFPDFFPGPTEDLLPPGSRYRYVAWWPNPNVAASNSGYYLVIVEIPGTPNMDRAYIVSPDGTRSMKGEFAAGGDWQHTFFQGGFALIINNGLNVPQFILDPDGNTALASVPNFAPLPGWESYDVQEVLLSDIFTQNSSLIFDTQREIDFTELTIVVEANGEELGAQIDTPTDIAMLESGVIALATVTGAQTTIDYQGSPLQAIVDITTGRRLETMVRRGDNRVAGPTNLVVDDENTITFDSFDFMEGDVLEVRYFNYTPVMGSYQLFRLTGQDNHIAIVFPSDLEVGTSVRIIERSNTPVFVRAGIVRAFGDFLVAGNLVERNAEDLDSPIIRSLVGVVRSSDVAAPGNIPQNWNPFAAGVSTADEFVITSDGIVQDMAELQGNLYIYSNTSIAVMSQTGNPAVPLTVRPVTDSYGAQTTDAVLEFDGKHIVVGSQDIYLFGGHPGSIQSVADGRIRRRFFDRINPLHEENMFILRYQQRDEIWICIPSVDSVAGELDEAYIWNYRLNNWTVRDLRGVVAGDIGPVPGGGIPSTLVDVNGESGDNGVTNIGAVEVQALTIDPTLDLDRLRDYPDGENEVQTISLFDAPDPTAMPPVTAADVFPTFQAEERETFEIGITDDWDTGPNATIQQSTLTIPNSSFTYSPSFRSSGAELFLNWDNPEDNPDNGDAATLITATELYAQTPFNGMGTNDGELMGLSIVTDPTEGADETVTLAAATSTATVDGVTLTFNEDGITYNNANQFIATGNGANINPGTGTLQNFRFQAAAATDRNVTAPDGMASINADVDTINVPGASNSGTGSDPQVGGIDVLSNTSSRPDSTTFAFSGGGARTFNVEGPITSIGGDLRGRPVLAGGIGFNFVTVRTNDPDSSAVIGFTRTTTNTTFTNNNPYEVVLGAGTSGGGGTLAANGGGRTVSYNTPGWTVQSARINDTGTGNGYAGGWAVSVSNNGTVGVEGTPITGSYPVNAANAAPVRLTPFGVNGSGIITQVIAMGGSNNSIELFDINGGRIPGGIVAQTQGVTAVLNGNFPNVHTIVTNSVNNSGRFTSHRGGSFAGIPVVQTPANRIVFLNNNNAAVRLDATSTGPGGVVNAGATYTAQAGGTSTNADWTIAYDSTTAFTVDFTNIRTDGESVQLFSEDVFGVNRTSGVVPGIPRTLAPGETFRGVSLATTGEWFLLARRVVTTRDVRVRTPSRTVFTTTNTTAGTIFDVVVNGRPPVDLASGGINRYTSIVPIGTAAPEDWTLSGLEILAGRRVPVGTLITNQVFLQDLSTAINADLIPAFVWADTTLAGAVLSFREDGTDESRGPRRIRVEAGVFSTFSGVAPTTLSEGTVANPVCPTVFPFTSTVSGVTTTVVEDGTQTVTNTLNATTTTATPLPGVTVTRTVGAPTFQNIQSTNVQDDFVSTLPASPGERFVVSGSFPNNALRWQFQGPRPDQQTITSGTFARSGSITGLAPAGVDQIRLSFQGGTQANVTVFRQRLQAGPAMYTASNTSTVSVTINGVTIAPGAMDVDLGTGDTLRTTTVTSRYTIAVQNTRTRELDDEIDGFEFFNNGTRVYGPIEFTPELGIVTVATQVTSPKYSWEGEVPTAVTETFTETTSPALSTRGITGAVSTIAGGGESVTGTVTGVAVAGPTAPPARGVTTRVITGSPSNAPVTYTVQAGDEVIRLSAGGGDPDSGTAIRYTLNGVQRTARDGNQSASVYFGLNGGSFTTPGSRNTFFGIPPSADGGLVNVGDVISITSAPRDGTFDVGRGVATTNVSGVYMYTPTGDQGALVIAAGRPLTFTSGGQTLTIEPTGTTTWYLNSGITEADNFAIAQGAIPLPNGTNYTVDNNRTINFTIPNTADTNVQVNGTAFRHEPATTMVGAPGPLTLRQGGTVGGINNPIGSVNYDVDPGDSVIIFRSSGGPSPVVYGCDSPNRCPNPIGNFFDQWYEGPAYTAGAEVGVIGGGTTRAGTLAAGQNFQRSSSANMGGVTRITIETTRAVTTNVPVVNIGYNEQRRFTLSHNNEEPITGGSLTFGGDNFTIPDPWNPNDTIIFDSSGTNEAFSFTGTRVVINEGENIIMGSAWANQEIGSVAGPNSPQISLRVLMTNEVTGDPDILDALVVLARNQTVDGTTTRSDIAADLLMRIQATPLVDELFESFLLNGDDTVVVLRARAVGGTMRGATGFPAWPTAAAPARQLFPDHGEVSIEFATFELMNDNTEAVVPTTRDTRGSGVVVADIVNFMDVALDDGAFIPPPLSVFTYGFVRMVDPLTGRINTIDVADQRMVALSLHGTGADGNVTPASAAELIRAAWQESTDWSASLTGLVNTVTASQPGPQHIMHEFQAVGASGLADNQLRIAEVTEGIFPTTGDNAVALNLPRFVLTNSAGLTFDVRLTNDTTTPLTFDGIWTQIFDTENDAGNDFNETNWAISSDLPSGYTQLTGSNRIVSRDSGGVEPSTWTMTLIDRGNVGLTPANWEPNFQTSKNHMNGDVINGLTVGPLNDFRGQWLTYASPTYMAIRVRNPLLDATMFPLQEEIILMRIGERGDYNTVTQGGTNGEDKMVGPEAMAERFQNTLRNITRNLVVTDGGTQGEFLIQPAVYSDIANFVLEVQLNDTDENAATIQGWLASTATLAQHPRNATVLETTQEPGVDGGPGQPVVRRATNSPDRVIQVGWSQTTATMSDTRRPDTFGRGVDFASAADPNTSVGSAFDVFRPWPTSQVNFNQEYPLFVSTVFLEDNREGSPTRNQELVSNKLLGADLGWTIPLHSLTPRDEEQGFVTVTGNVVGFDPSPTGTTVRIAPMTNDFPMPYESYFERTQMGLTPEFDTEQTTSVALWADGSTQQAFQQPSERNRLEVRMLGTDNPGEMMPLADGSTATNRRSKNLFPIGFEYKADMRIQGRFMNYRVTDSVTDTTDMAELAEIPVVFGQNVEWRVSGMQVDFKKGGTR